MLPWWEVRDSLLKEAKNEERIEIRLGVSVNEVAQDKTGANSDVAVTATLSDDSILKASVLIGADGVHSHVRSNILKLPPAKPTNAFVWRGDVNVQEIPELLHLTEGGISSFQNYGGGVLMALFNFHSKLPGTIAWTLSSNNKSKIVVGQTTPLDMIEECLNSDDDQKSEQARIAKLLFENSRAHELSWCTEMSVVDLEGDDGSGWGGDGLLTLIGDAAHAIRPASGQG
eukprot:CAMPEP_0202473508 /NCGR_PEP_ID=MMETSP1360-20130828/91204_1 /ASSEMBLY_ACC=CAM_ASM_000848 /TAXON_ID=515479 /ORGANISM="Licmophora paradoxa, Strain CCMP2313" /LENGTH=228 /DNA_ID=CAMNT_0049100447 /DNA_START=42 /DNA_END=725 /DNA_ORIENTATION=-